MAVPQISKMKLPYDPATPFLGIHPKELKEGSQRDMFHTHVHSSPVHNSQEMEATQISTKGWTDEQMW